MGRGKIEIKRIENQTNRQVTFSKRRTGLFKKAHELGILCDAQVGLVVFSSSGKTYEYSSPHTSIPQIIEHYQRTTKTRFEEIDNHDQQLFCEIARMRSETESLQANIRQFTGEDLSTLTLNDVNQLEEQLDYSLNKVRNRKHQLLHQQVENLRRKEHLLEDQNSYLCRVLSENQAAALEQQHGPMLDHKVGEVALLENFGHFFPEVDASRNLLQLSPQLHTFRLQPTQPNLQEASLHGSGLQL